MTKIDDLVIDPRYGLFSIDKLYKKLVADGHQISYKKLKKILDNEVAYQLTKVQRKPHSFNQIYAPYPGANYQMDIIVYDRYTYHNYKYIYYVSLMFIVDMGYVE